MKKICFGVIVVCSFALSGCATVLNGTSQDVGIDTKPGGASVRLTGGETCTTPCKIKLKRKDDLRADFSLDGYRPEYVLVQSRLGGSTFGNILLGGGIGAVVDGTNGASNRLYPEPLILQMVPNGSVEQALLLKKDGATLASVEQHNDSVRMDVAKTIGAEQAALDAGQAAEFEARQGDKNGDTADSD